MSGDWRLGMAALVVGILSLAGCSNSEKAPKYSFLHDATTAPSISFYDYIIIGGGTAGCPLAATLSETSSVLVLERGGSPYGNPNITNLASFDATLADTSPTSASQRFVSTDGVINARARVLGGGTCLNAGFYTHASTDFINKSRWDPDLVSQAYKWVERVVAHEPPMLAWQSAFRDGLIEAGVTPFNGFTFEHMYGTKVGGTIFDRRGRRHTAADLLEYARPEGINVMLWATVQRILFRIRANSKPIARGVVFQDAQGRRHRAYLNKGANNEIILAAGAMGSPQILMLSGVGPAEELWSKGITVVVDQPLVGQGMSDNPMNAIFVPSLAPVETSLIEVVGITHVGSFIEGASGPNLAGRPDRRDFGMFSPQIGQLSTVPPKQRTPEAIARAVEAMNRLPASSFNGGFILEKIVGPFSTGNLSLDTLNPDDNPAVTFNYFSDPRDLRMCVGGLQTIERVIESPSFFPFRYPSLSLRDMVNMTSNYPVNLRARHDNDSSSLEQFCRDTVMTIWHYHGGCQVGRVVDAKYRVIGVQGLRVIDGSTFHSSPGTNPQATVMMLGRYMGVKIKEERFGMTSKMEEKKE